MFGKDSGNNIMKIINKGIATLALGLSLSLSANAAVVQVEVSNLFDDGGLALTPVWVGFHDGTFDSFDDGSAASASLQNLAENGVTGDIASDFAASSTGTDGTIFAFGGNAPVFEPGESATSGFFSVDPTTSGYFSFLSMLIPTNDAFIGNDNPLAYSLFNSQGIFQDLEILVLGSEVRDAGTELNRGFGAPFLVGGGAEPRQDENGVVTFSNGLSVLPGGLAIIGSNTPTGYTIEQAAADFTQAGFEVARISVTQVTEPETLTLLSLGILGFFMARRRKQVKL